MSAARKYGLAVPSRKGDARPIPEPRVKRQCPPEGRRVGAVLPNDLFAAFRHYVALSGTTGDQLIRDAVHRMIKEG